MDSTYSRWLDIRDRYLDHHQDTIMIAKFMGMEEHPDEYDKMVYKFNGKDNDVINISDLDFSTYANLMPVIETIKAIYTERSLEKINQVWEEDLCEENLYQALVHFIKTKHFQHENNRH